jgi:SAM-dependent methyltransferase
MQNKNLLQSCPICNHRTKEDIFIKNGYNLVKCLNCKTAFIDNPPNSNEMEIIYSKENDYHATLISENNINVRQQQRIASHHLSQLLAVEKSGILIDNGCSTGLFLESAKDAGFTASGVEFSKDSAAAARAFTGMDIYQGRLEDVSILAESIDIITMWDVIEHVPFPIETLKKSCALLKPGGLIALSTPNIDGLFPKMSYFLANQLSYWPHPEPPYHLFQFSVSTLSSALEKSGFNPFCIIHENIPLAYSFGNLSTLISLPKRLLYSIMFSPFAAIGPWLRMGDSFTIFARKL